MRWFLTLLLLASLAKPALAHGGGGFRDGPNGRVPPGLREPFDPVPPPRPPGIPCACSLIECDQCSSAELRGMHNVRVSVPQITESKRWGDIALCRVEISFETSREKRAVEAYARLDPGPLFAAVGGSVRSGEETLAAELKPGEQARGRFLHAPLLRPVDTLLVLRRGPGRIDVRAFPVSKDVKTVIVIEGYLLVDATAPDHVKLYRTGDRYLAVVPLEKDAHRDSAAFRDERTGRALHFLSATACQRRFGTDAAKEVPFVAALEAAATGRGDGAASDTTALLAIPVTAPAPPALSSGLRGPSLQPVDRSDPEPPPPAPAPPLELDDPEPPPPDPAVRDFADSSR